MTISKPLSLLLAGVWAFAAPLAPFSAVRQALCVPFLPGDADVEPVEDASLRGGEGVELNPV